MFDNFEVRNIPFFWQNMNVLLNISVLIMAEHRLGFFGRVDSAE